MTEMPVLDKDVFDELIAQLGSEDTAEVLQAFLADTFGKVNAIASGLLDRPTIMREAHSIKSSAAAFGFSCLSLRARELELRAEAMRPSELLEFAAEFHQVFENTSRFANANLLNVSPEIAS